VMRRVPGLPTVGAGQLLTVLLLTRLAGLPIIRISSLAPLFGPSLRRALNFSGGFPTVGRMPWRHRAVSLSTRAARFTDFVYTASRKGSVMESKTRRGAGASRATQTDEDLVDVLLVEDDPSVLEMYRLKLELDGYRVNTALDGEEGLKKAGDLTPDIIFLDIRLPKMDGLEVLRKLRGQEKTRDIPV